MSLAQVLVQRNQTNPFSYLLSIVARDHLRRIISPTNPLALIHELPSSVVAPESSELPADLMRTYAYDESRTLLAHSYGALLILRQIAFQASARGAAETTLADLLYKHRVYLEKIANEGEISPSLREVAWEALTQILEQAEEDVDVPDAIPGTDDHLYYTWRSKEYYLDLELMPDGLAEFFFRNMKTGEYSSFPWRVGEPLPRKALQGLKLFRRV